MRWLAGRVVLGMFAAVFWCLQDFETPAQDSISSVQNGQRLDQQGADTQGIEVLARGPIHEAFAQPVVNGAVDVLVVPKQPPEPVSEVPPDVRPEGDDIVWIPGYWAWDDDRQDFLWVSGVWRETPPGSRWVSGYWSQVDNSYRWVPGFWSSTEVQEVTYYPEPPQSLEQGPTGPAPSDDHFWVPGCWLWRDVRFAWRPGYWTIGHPHWVWVPARYSWCPSGWVFSDGYWDYPLARRGLLFAPIAFTQPIWRQPNYYYRPASVVDVTYLTIQLFARPRYFHYYFGDYYAPTYARYGIQPWYTVRENRYYTYDPLYSYYRWQHRHDPRWDENVRGWYRYYQDNERYRPPRTYAEQRRVRQAEPNRPDINNFVMVQPIQEVRQRTNASVRLTDVTPEQRRQLQERVREERQFSQQRSQIENRLVATETRPGQVPGKEKPGTATTRRTVERPERAKLPPTPETRIATRPDRPDTTRGQSPGADDRRPDGKPQTRPQAPPKPDRSDAKPDARPQTPPKTERPDAKPDARPQAPPKTDRPDARPQTPPKAERPDARPEPRKEAKPEPGKPDFPGRDMRGDDRRPVPTPPRAGDGPNRPGTPDRRGPDADRPGANRPDSGPSGSPRTAKRVPLDDGIPPAPQRGPDMNRPGQPKPQGRPEAPPAKRGDDRPDRGGGTPRVDQGSRPRPPAPQAKREAPREEARRPEPPRRDAGPPPKPARDERPNRNRDDDRPERVKDGRGKPDR